MNRLMGLLKKDFKIAFRNFFFLIVVVVAVILILVTNFLIPQEVSMDSRIYYTVEGKQQGEIQPIVQVFQQQEGNRQVEGKDEIIKEMKEDREAMGLVIKADEEKKPTFEIILQGYESEQSKNAFILYLESILNSDQVNRDIETVVLKEAIDNEEIPFNKRFVPLMILNEPVMLGFILLATLIFMEKDEDTIKAYLVSPGGLIEYLGAKVILIAVLGLISTLLITLFTIGLNVNWPMLLTITIAGSLFSSTIAMFLASFFDSISKAMVWVLGVSILLTAPMISYFVPSFAPRVITAIPTYSLMFAIREALFPGTNQTIYFESMLTLIVISAVLFGLSILSYRHSLLRD